MLSDSLLHIASGNISAGIQADDSINAVAEFIKRHFAEFAERNKKDVISNEKGLNQKLCIFLNQRIKAEPFFFHHEFMENEASGISPQVDIGTIYKPESVGTFDRQYNNDDSFFSMEAKRLPTVGANREKEYVIGYDSPCGAMERFKKGIHGSRLKYAAIIGYIQNETFDYWFLKINSWIEELALNNNQILWAGGDKITKENTNSDVYLELSSINSRITEDKEIDKIKIFHFWINLIEKTN
ncbi:MAG: hypothetical protein JST09_19085 [Bacteroidetes bacterium]|nr:hypothetical protein [Bacteroidota bacterium]